MAEECMNTDILSVREDDPAELVARMMEWKNIHHVPVENQRGELIGLITTTHLKRHVAEGKY
ncbi:MAG: CBS domain-containing protein [Bacteroidetes bacterium]|nr:CBS domain-containing protein [Bacteroidota bacterium]